eukprot:5027362-Prymnesium_polylepis.1
MPSDDASNVARAKLPMAQKAGHKPGSVAVPGRRADTSAMPSEKQNLRRTGCANVGCRQRECGCDASGAERS